MSNIYQLKITLRDIEPVIWRRLLVPGNLNLQRLHRVIQDAMGWEDDHLHSFEVDGEEYGPVDPERWGHQPHNEKQYTLERIATAKDRFEYTYDFGDNWVHEIEVEEVTTGEPIAPRCIEGAQACPPEDCGGPWGYGELLAALADPEHPRHAERSEWLIDDWSPERFDVAQADRRVARHRPERGRPRAKLSKGPRSRVNR